MLLLLAGFVSGCKSQPATPEATPTPASIAEVHRISLQEAKVAFDAGTAVFLDVRDNSSYAQAHIPGALNIPLSDLSARQNELNPKSWIIPYCT